MARHRNRDERLEDHSAPGGPVIEEVPTLERDPDARISAEPAGFQDVAQMSTTIGAAAGGYLRDDESDPNDLEQARLRLHDIQVALVALGYDVSSGSRGGGGDGIDGMWGPATRDAVADFQDEHDLPATGQLDSDTYQAILGAYETALESAGGDLDPELSGDEDEFTAVQPSHAMNLERDQS